MEPEKKTILMLGTFDSKGNEFQYLYEELLRRGVNRNRLIFTGNLMLK